VYICDVPKVGASIRSLTRHLQKDMTSVLLTQFKRVVKTGAEPGIGVLTGWVMRYSLTPVFLVTEEAAMPLLGSLFKQRVAPRRTSSTEQVIHPRSFRAPSQPQLGLVAAHQEVHAILVRSYRAQPLHRSGLEQFDHL
jgi:hypothetical protein